MDKHLSNLQDRGLNRQELTVWSDYQWMNGYQKGTSSCLPSTFQKYATYRTSVKKEYIKIATKFVNTTLVQVWSLTHLFSVNFSQSRISEKGLRQPFLTESWDLRA